MPDSAETSVADSVDEQGVLVQRHGVCWDVLVRKCLLTSLPLQYLRNNGAKAGEG